MGDKRWKTGHMLSSRVVAVVSTAAALALVLSGCSADPHPSVLPYAARVALYERSADRQWDAFAPHTPTALRPDLRVRTVSTGARWVLDMSRCLGGPGLASLQSTADRPIDLAGATDNHDINTRISEFVCQAQHPTSAQLRAMLSPSEAGVLYDYYVDSLQPCLLLNAGVIPRRPPARAAFVSVYSGTSWSPYDASPKPDAIVDGFGDLTQTALGRRCPRFPSWVTHG